GGQGRVHREVLLLLDRRHKAIALAVQRTHETWRPPLLPQGLAQRRDTGLQRRVPDKLVGPQVLEEFLLGDHPLAVRQEAGEHLKRLGPELDGLPSVMQLMTLGVKHIVAKDVVHRFAALPTLEPCWPWAIPCVATSSGSRPHSPEAT